MNRRRRWFQFRLRTMLLVVLLFLCAFAWLAVQIKWIKDRHDMLSHREPHRYPQIGGDPRGRAPWSIRLLGEPGYSIVGISGDFNHLSPDEQRLMSQLQLLFPEAWIVAVPERF